MNTNSGSYRGTGYILNWNLRGKQIKFVITCAHNLGEVNGSYLTTYSDITCYTLWNGYNSYAKKYRVLKAFVHPCWKGDPDTGFDYGIGILGAPSDGNLALDDSEINDDYFVAEVGATTGETIAHA